MCTDNALYSEKITLQTKQKKCQHFIFCKLLDDHVELAIYLLLKYFLHKEFRLTT